MRIGLVSYEYPPQQGLGGVGTYMFRLATALGRAGHEVHVIAGPSQFAAVAQPHVTLHRIPAHYQLSGRTHRAFHWLYWKGFARAMGWMHPAIWHWMKWNLASYHAIQELHARYPLDLIEVPEHAANGAMAGRIHRWPIVMRMHCPWDLFVRVNRFPFNPMHRLLSAMERRAVANVPDALTVPSAAMLEQVTRSWKMRRPPMVVPNFMDIPDAPAPLPPEGGEQRIVCVGRIEPLKGQDTLVRAFASIARKHPRAWLQLVGPDRWPGKRRFAELLHRLAPDTEIRSRIEMPGAVPLESVPEILREARLVVIPSRGFESFSYAALEAMAMARPTIASSVGALPELIDHERSGLLVPPAEAPLLAGAMDRLLGDRGASEELALAGYRRAKDRYDTSRVLPLILAAYEDAGDFFYQVRAAGSRRTALAWRRAHEAARKSRDAGSLEMTRAHPRPENFASFTQPRYNVA